MTELTTRKREETQGGYGKLVLLCVRLTGIHHTLEPIAQLEIPEGARPRIHNSIKYFCII
jgi:hypothetical protein